VIGSIYLEKRIRSLKPHLHLFGHTHIPIDLTIDGIRYLQWPLGTHKESKRQCGLIHHSGPLLVYDSLSVAIDRDDGGYGADNNVNDIDDNVSGRYGIPVNLASEQVHWTQYYRHYARNPNVTDIIAPWVQKRLDRFRGLIMSGLANTEKPKNESSSDS